jgi:hypothetical protein
MVEQADANMCLCGAVAVYYARGVGFTALGKVSKDARTHTHTYTHPQRRETETEHAVLLPRCARGVALTALDKVKIHRERNRETNRHTYICTHINTYKQR